MNFPYNFSESLKILKFFDADPEFFFTLDPGSGINIPDSQHCPKSIDLIAAHKCSLAAWVHIVFPKKGFFWIPIALWYKIFAFIIYVHSTE
jgi:hypothetical protein